MSLAKYFDPDDADDTLRAYAEEADRDSDAVSLEWLLPSPPSSSPVDSRLPDEPIEGAFIFIKGDANVRAFVEWAKERGLITEGKPWADPPPRITN